MRTQLEQFLNKETLFYAIFDQYDETAKGRVVAVVKDIRVKDSKEILTDHVWINRTSGMKDLKLRQGDIVSFYAQAEKYAHGPGSRNAKVGSFDYGLSRIRDLRLHRQFSKKDDRWPHFLLNKDILESISNE